MNNKTAIVVGGAGFTGTALTESLRSQGYGVYNVVRPNSRHISRLDSKDIGIHIVEDEIDDKKKVLFNTLGFEQEETIKSTH